mgnify:CR=1 FL=1
MEINVTNATVQIPKDVLEPVIQAEVTKAVVSALGEKSQVLHNAICRLITMPVDSEGKHCTYGNAKPWIEWATGIAIRNAAKAAIEEALAKHQDNLKAALVAEMSKKNSPLIRQLVEGMVGAMAHPDVLRWRLNVTYDEKK